MPVTWTGHASAESGPLVLAASLLIAACGAEDAPARAREPIDDAVAVAGGDGHACVLRASGAVACWGDNRFGQLGLAGEHDDPSDFTRFDPYEFFGLTPAEDEPHPDAEPVRGADEAIAVSAGANHTCTITADRHVQCWGDHLNAQLGSGDFSSDDCAGRPCNRRATDVPGLRDVAALSLGRVHSCALLGDGRVSCWGTGAFDRTDRTARCTSGPCATTPVVLDFDPGVVQVASGTAHSCALLGDGRVQCWGSNWVGQLGIPDAPRTDSGQLEPVSKPEQVALPHAAVEIWVRGSHTCALLEDGSLYCWGEHRYGELGVSTAEENCLEFIGLSFPCVTAPRRVPLPAAVTHVWPSVAGTCVRTADDELWCWGLASAGQLGSDTRVLRGCPPEPGLHGRCANAPVRIDIDGRFEAMLYGLGICGLRADGSVTCWGFGQFDENDQLQPSFAGLDCTTPAQACDVERTWPGTARELFYAGGRTCVRTDRGEIFCLTTANLPAEPLMVLE